ncbi:hypothetical protein AWJ07_05815 [Shewanella frigidimarina]|uniref:Uncharacterized protein n=1 Tax=Shewanella frigidimarina TaxID=56812 RepID=A0A106BYK5_SHEFR|nr:hypothetical protein AWJ07_05815 [Shewanella frigidimarina]
MAWNQCGDRLRVLKLMASVEREVTHAGSVIRLGTEPDTNKCNWMGFTVKLDFGQNLVGF